MSIDWQDVLQAWSGAACAANQTNHNVDDIGIMIRMKTGIRGSDLLPYIGSGLCLSLLLSGCCIAPSDPGAVPVTAPVADSAAPAADAFDPAMTEVDAPPLADAGSLDAEATAAAEPLADSAPVAPADSAPAVAAPSAPAAPPAAAAAPAPAPLAGTKYAYDDVGLSLVVPQGWTQQLMAGGIIALFSGDYGGGGTGALMLISKHAGSIPADDATLEATLKGGLDPAAVKQAGPIRFPLAGKQAAQLIAKGTNDDGAGYEAMHTLMQSGDQAVSVKSMAFDSLSSRKPTFDGVMESIVFSGG